MVDPYIGLVSYQQALSQGIVHPEPGRIHPELTLLVDDVPGGKRLTYAYADGLTVKATAIYVMNGRSGGKPYFQVGYAVAENFRGQGIAQKVLQLSISEITAGFKKLIPSFYIEAVVSKTNLPSLHIAQKVIGGSPEEITDQESGESALRFTMLVGD
jgi:predicted GNAT family acetyltransferase